MSWNFCPASVDADQVSRSMDVETLQDNMMNITFCNIESELVSVIFITIYIEVSFATIILL